jgi:hypothetical protein
MFPRRRSLRVIYATPMTAVGSSAVAVFDEVRKHRRLIRDIPIQWAIEAQGLRGEGMLLDVSLTGGRLRIGAMFNGKGGATFTLVAPSVPMLPAQARLRWFRRLEGRSPVFLCGVIFGEPGLSAKEWTDWLAGELEAQRAKSPAQ